MKNLLLACVLLLPFDAFAQDGVMISGDSMMFSVPDYGSVMMAQSSMRSAFGKTSKRDASRKGQAATQRPSSPAPRSVPVSYNPAISQKMQQEYLASLERNAGKPAAKAFAAYFQRKPMHGQFAIAAGPFGLRREDLVDVVTAYFTVMWMTANQAPVPSREQVAGLRRQMQQVLHESGTVPSNPEQRQRLAESLMYKLVSMILLREEAQASNNRAVLQQLAASAGKEGFDLKNTRLTVQGFVSR